jgi:hypothetical protein
MSTNTEKNAKISESMKGNNNATKNKLFYDRIRKALTQEPHRLAKIVDKLIEEAEEGEAWAVKEIMDRVDGKAVQSNEISGADGQALSGLQVVFIDGKSES